MYTSVSSLHIALDSRLQQLNSNRKIAIMPEQYDVALNDAISIVLKQRLSAKLNAKREGYEDSVTAYDNVKSLKRTCRPICYFDSTSDKWCFELPSDYYMFDTLQANINYNRSQTTYNLIGTQHKYVTKLYFTNKGVNPYIFKKDDIRYNVYQTSMYSFLETDNIHLTGTSNKASFYYFNLIKDWFKAKHKINCYFENYLGEYFNNTLVFVTNTPLVPTGNVEDFVWNGNPSSVRGINEPLYNVTMEIENIVLNTANTSDSAIDMGSKKIDLISSLNDTNETTDFYLHYNNHLNPKCVMQEDIVLLTTDPTFYYTNVRLNYIKQPRPLDSRINQMTDMDMAEDVLDAATQLLFSTLNIRDPYADAEAQKQQKESKQNN
jgi:hypothetical protein